MIDFLAFPTMVGHDLRWQFVSRLSQNMRVDLWGLLPRMFILIFAQCCQFLPCPYCSGQRWIVPPPPHTHTHHHHHFRKDTHRSSSAPSLDEVRLLCLVCQSVFIPLRFYPPPPPHCLCLSPSLHTSIYNTAYDYRCH